MYQYSVGGSPATGVTVTDRSVSAPAAVQSISGGSQPGAGPSATLNGTPACTGWLRSTTKLCTWRRAPGTAARKLGCSVDTLPPGKLSCPYHLHHAQEEMFIVIEGSGYSRKINCGGGTGSEIWRMTIANQRKERVNFSFPVRVDRRGEWEQLFEESWRVMKYRFYDEKMHGRDWRAIKAKYEPLLKYVGENQDVYDLANEMIGELNASHTGGRYRPRRENVDATAAVRQQRYTRWERWPGRDMSMSLVRRGIPDWQTDRSHGSRRSIVLSSGKRATNRHA